MIDATDDANAQVDSRLVKKMWVWVGAVLLLLGMGAARSVVARMDNDKVLAAQSQSGQAQFVKVTQAQMGGAGQKLSLPGTLQGYIQAPVSARTPGYLKKWHRDIGAKVKQGELLAEIDAPEVDQQLGQAVATRDQAAASLELALSTVERWEGLRRKDVVSQQELDERRSAAQQARANLAAAQANVQRLQQLEGFKRIVAPFSGVITRRLVDVGDLIDGGGAKPLFVMAQVDPLRVYVNVPQASAHLIKTGLEVSVSQSEWPGKLFTGKVVRTAGALDAITRTLQVEVTLANPQGVLMPGAYVQVSLPAGGSATLTVPNNVLMFRAEGPLVAVVDASGRVTLKPVKLGRNFGERVQVMQGVDLQERLVVNPSDALSTGDQVKVVEAKAEAKAEAKPDAKADVKADVPQKGRP